MLTNIKLKNFKCFEQLDLDCRPLNLLCGLNGTGKSSVLQALLVLRQSFETRELLRGLLVLSGERIDLGTGQDVLFQGARDPVAGFALQDGGTVDTWKKEFVLFDDVAIGDDKDRAMPVEGVDYVPGNYVPAEWRGVPPFGGSLIYVNAERVGPRKSYPRSPEAPPWGEEPDFGASSEYAWSYLNRHRHSLLAKVDQWLQYVSPGVHLQLKEVYDADAIITRFSFDRPGDGRTRLYRATNVGFGLSYVLPVVLALLAEPGTLCLIENPESHLHPRGQTKLGELAARASKAGVQVFVETHSDHFMDGVRIAVRDGLIEPEDVAFHYFERQGGKAVVSSPQVDADGRLSEWPAGFFDQHEENLVRLLAPRS